MKGNVVGRRGDGELALLRGKVMEDDKLNEYRAERGCRMGVGCNGSLCYAEAVGKIELCGRIDEYTENR